jgi:hypothetical protein
MNRNGRERGRARRSFDLGEDLRKDVQRNHRRVDRILERAERLRAHYKEDHNVRWLESAERLRLNEALAEYRRASRRAAIVTRLLNTAQRCRRMETCDRRVADFVANHVVRKPLDRAGSQAALAVSRALYRYLFVASDRTNDQAVRAAWRKLGRAIASKRADNAFLFEIPEQRPARKTPPH